MMNHPCLVTDDDPKNQQQQLMVVAGTSVSPNLKKMNTTTKTMTKLQSSSRRQKKVKMIRHHDLRPFDILCGRTADAFNYVGNRRFRVTIELNLERYIESSSRKDKSQVIQSIVDLLRDDVGGRFLRLSCNGKGGYQELEDKQCREKVGHAFRDMIGARSDMIRRRGRTSPKKQQGTRKEEQCYSWSWSSSPSETQSTPSSFSPIPIRFDSIPRTNSRESSVVSTTSYPPMDNTPMIAMLHDAEPRHDESPRTGNTCSWSWLDSSMEEAFLSSFEISPNDSSLEPRPLWADCRSS